MNAQGGRDFVTVAIWGVATTSCSAWIAAVGVLTVAPGALAGTVQAEGGFLLFEAGSGERNEVTLTQTSHRPGALTFRVRDGGADLEARAGCVAVTAREASCVLEFSLVSGVLPDVVVALDDEDDSLIASLACERVECAFFANGGAGNDHLVGSNQKDELAGGEGDDLLEGRGGTGDALHGEEGDDVLKGGGGNDELHPFKGADSVYGGRGLRDRVHYGYVRGVRVELDDRANDGLPGEGDNVRSDVESVIGGRGDDTLIGNTEPNMLNGFLGNDRIFGRGGNDRLLGSWGEDLVVGGRGNDVLGLARGRDRGYGRTGDDFLDAKDRHVDTVNGGPGSDSARVNIGDRVTRVERIRP